MERRGLAVRLCTAILLAACLVFASSIGRMALGGPQKTDSLYIGDTNDDSVRRFDVPTGDFGDIFATSAHLGQPWYLTFGKTNPATLAYE